MVILKINGFDEPLITSQYPINICEFLKVNAETLSSITSKHLSSKDQPNFIETTLNPEIKVASLYTGSTEMNQVGELDHAIVVFLSEDDTLAEDFDGQLRRVAHELLPMMDALNFDDIFGKYFEMLKTGELNPFRGDSSEKDSSVEAEATQGEDVSEPNEIQEMIEQIDTSTELYTQETEELGEVDLLKVKTIELEDLLAEKTNKIRELTTKYTELSFDQTTKIEEIEALKGELGEQYLKIEDNNEKISELTGENASLKDQIDSIKLELESKETEIESLKSKLDKAETTIKEGETPHQEIEDLKNINTSLNSEIENLELERERLNNHLKSAKEENEIHLDSITNLKIEIKDLKTKIGQAEKDFDKQKDLIYDLKKEIKVLRRERDHYQNKLKENELL